MNKKACVTGITGQDGSYLAENLISRGYEVVGLHRRNSTNNFGRINHLIGHKLFHLQEFDITDPSCVSQIVIQNDPDEFYNLAAQSHVGTSFKQPSTTFNINTCGVVNILEAIRNYNPGIRFYQASTSEMFGCNFSFDEKQGKYQDEETPFSPQSPYAVAKVASHHTVKLYRDSYGLYACSGILFNHESPRRGETFVTRKITRGLARISEGLENILYLGNLDAMRDWGHAKEYCELMWLMLQQEKPIDFVIATGRQESVRKFIELTAKELNWGSIIWEGHGVDEIGRREDTNEIVIRIDEKYFRPTEVSTLLGDPKLAKNKLGWVPKITLEELVSEMVKVDKEEAQKELLLFKSGFKINSFSEHPPNL